MVLALALGVRAGPGTAVALDPATGVPDYPVHLWQVSSGLPQNNVKAVLQTRDGYIWIGTKGGLARFDGARFTVYDDLQAGRLPELEVWALAEDAQGVLWIGTFGGGLTRLQSGSFTTLTTRDGLASNFVTALAVGRDGAIWVGTESGGVNRIRGGAIEPIGAQQGLPDLRVRSLLCDPDGTVWIGTGNGLSAYRDGQLENHPLAMASDSRVTSIVGAGHELWLSTSGEGVFRFENGRFSKVAAAPTGASALWYDRQGALWIGSTAGVCRLRDENLSCTRRATAASAPIVRAAAIEQVQAFLEDDEGNLWIATASHGLAALKDTQFQNYGSNEGMPDERSRVVAAGRNGTVWVGTFTDVIRFRDGRFTTYTQPRPLSVHSLFEDTSGAVWIGSSSGLLVLRGDEIRDVPVPGLESWVTGVLRDRRGDVWAATNGQGLVRISGGTARTYTTADGLPGLTLRGIVEDARGDLWFGVREAGLCRLRDGKFTTFAAKDGLTSASVQSLHADPEGALWVSTRRGLNRVEEGRIRTLTAEEGLPVNLIYQVIKDAGGDLWLTCGRGLFRIPRASLEKWLGGATRRVQCVPYGRETGLRAGSFPAGTQPTACRTADGRLWFASLQGMAVTDPAREERRAFRPPVWIEKVAMDGAEGTGGAVRRFPAGPGDLDVDFTAPHFFSPERLSFRYRLDGVDRDWVDAGTRRSAHYTRLSPGTHRFEVAARVGDGDWLPSAEMRFERAAHLRETLTFRALLALAAAGVLGLAYRVRTARLRAAERVLQQRVDEAVANVQTLSGLLPICSWCRKVREDSGYWSQLEAYVAARSSAEFRQSICPDCLARVSGTG